MQSQLSEVAKAQWLPLLDRFSRAHHGEPVEFVIVAPDSGRHHAADLPLLGISSEATETGEHILIMAGTPGGAHVSHEISHPTHLRFAEWNDGASAQIEIDAEDGFVATVRVGAPAQTIPPGAMLNGNYERQ